MQTFLFITFDSLQIISSIAILRQIHTRRSIYALSIDFTLYSWVWAFTHTIANCLYSFLPNVYAQYAKRYPLSPEIPHSTLLTAMCFFQLILCTILVNKCFFVFKSQEKLSVVCKTVMLLCISVFLRFSWLFCNGKATINVLDLADCLHNIGSVALACRLIPQISLNWFLEIFLLSNTFLTLQLCAATSGIVSLFIAYSSGLLWSEMPIGLPCQAVLGATWCASLVLLFQRSHYGQKHNIHRFQNLV
ncbi:hypothetical protein METBIDRAFT_200338 [Metschnikowia bicuspidata var. bicuspidata NRRL YB-4993]|uniref:Uncharacterized protein n=1 Tax=Metschnikowia bicuspidata var. bicuspidata NRRL YB-4993 TaxID=869754 RepID=A0A1A0H938_9ASCO|nr:hypothetical protein METBIDRAFT_200338 [Metschnikowia bicuspidata var. bicuspidata NRRL YB-4993]OBA20515.1 hypothetical protein METBIDRAFT_200338 [Metschnikowia bicuspidata var. bicuspidata NRRL YB-4993]